MIAKDHPRDLLAKSLLSTGDRKRIQRFLGAIDGDKDREDLRIRINMAMDKGVAYSPSP